MGKPALIAGDTVRTYEELDDRCRRLAAVLLARGAGPGRPVATVLPNGVEPFEVACAAAMAGAPYLPVNWHLKRAELDYLLSDAGVGAVVGHADHLGELSQVDLVVGDDYEGAIEGSEADPSLERGPGPELVFYTSGTTARPKGVVHGGLGDPNLRRMGLAGQVALWEWTEDDVYILAGPAYHASHAGWALTSLFVGATTVILDRFSATGFLEATARYGGTRSFMVPAHFIRLLEATERPATPTLRLIVHGAAPCPVAVKRKMIETFPDVSIHELYGASEGGATRISPEEWLERPGSVGRPWPGVEVRILDDEGQPVPAGTDGIVWIQPPRSHRFTYRNDPEATAAAWRDGAFSVGDIGHVDEDGYLTITDRVSDMVLWGGVNIAPREVEEVLFDHDHVVDCAVFGVPDERDGEHLKAMVEVRGEVSEQELAEFVRARLADYKVPREWQFTTEIPRDPNGKVKKRLLRSLGTGD